MLLAIAMNGAAMAMATAHASLLGAMIGSGCPSYLFVFLGNVSWVSVVILQANRFFSL
jgi:hypothetical protein